MKNLSLGYSPCPNDTFIFYALVHNKLEGKLRFTERLEDVETLNRLALRTQLDITKVSFHALGHLRENYCLLRSGSALGRGFGPLIVSKKPMRPSELSSKKIAIPGKLTTAYLLLRLFAPDATDVVEMQFDRIMNAVELGMVDAGLIIHEGRFTYPEYNLVEIIDLGEWWEKETGYPIPLGCILARRELGVDLINEIDRMLKESVGYAFRNPGITWEYVKNNAQELEDEVIRQHIELYVNEYTLDIGEGADAAGKLLKTAEELHIIPESNKPFFID
ncbi:MAG: 1,4-dihydroxy-6-naphthoate synthase [Candidatus Methanoperedens sp.]|nr:1,4-dihydroxy-6-naphthoate synthase [Candidatus Methanoperedens sp.]